MGHSVSDLSLVLSFMLQTSPVTCGSCVVPPDLLSTLKGTFSYSPIVSGGPIYIYIYILFLVNSLQNKESLRIPAVFTSSRLSPFCSLERIPKVFHVQSQG